MLRRDVLSCIPDSRVPRAHSRNSWTMCKLIRLRIKAYECRMRRLLHRHQSMKGLKLQTSTVRRETRSLEIALNGTLCLPRRHADLCRPHVSPTAGLIVNASRVVRLGPANEEGRKRIQPQDVTADQQKTSASKEAQAKSRRKRRGFDRRGPRWGRAVVEPPFASPEGARFQPN